MKKNLLYLFLLLSLLPTACSGGSGADVLASPTTQLETASLNSLLNILGNLSYTGIFPEQPITLKDGYYAYSEGGSGNPHVSLVEELIMTGDLNADQAQDAILMLEDDSEGSGRLTFLVAVLNVFEDPKPVEAVLLGGRSGVKSLALDGSQVVADIVTQGPGDADCCASWNAQVVYALEDGRLVEKSRSQGAQISLNDLDGTQWRLAAQGAEGQDALPDSGITLQFEGDHVSGFAGCNDYGGVIQSGEAARNTITVDSVASVTQKSCSEPAASQEKAYLEALAKASSWVVEYGNLAIIYGMGDNLVGKLLFVPIDQ